jgi:hypothetical protein
MLLPLSNTLPTVAVCSPRSQRSSLAFNQAPPRSRKPFIPFNQAIPPAENRPYHLIKPTPLRVRKMNRMVRQYISFTRRFPRSGYRLYTARPRFVLATRRHRKIFEGEKGKYQPERSNDVSILLTIFLIFPPILKLIYLTSNLG